MSAEHDWIVEWVDGGATNPENTALLCRYHHYLVHEGEWTITGNADLDGNLTFHPPPDSNSRPVRGERKTVHTALRKLLAAIKEGNE